jgi:hypothetical protein
VASGPPQAALSRAHSTLPRCVASAWRSSRASRSFEGKIYLQSGLGRTHCCKQMLCLREHPIMPVIHQIGDERFLSGDPSPALLGEAPSLLQWCFGHGAGLNGPARCQFAFTCGSRQGSPRPRSCLPAAAPGQSSDRQ